MTTLSLSKKYDVCVDSLAVRLEEKKMRNEFAFPFADVVIVVVGVSPKTS